MSADDGYIIRKNNQGKFVLQHYMGESYPDVEKAHEGEIFDTLELAVLSYSNLSSYEGTVSEYGLSVHLGESQNEEEKKEDPHKMKIEKFIRKPFAVQAVQVTSENIKEVAAWCDGTIEGEIRDGKDERYVSVRVYYPLSPRQTKAFINDWVLYAGKGYKVYNPRAFENNFDKA